MIQTNLNIKKFEVKVKEEYWIKKLGAYLFFLGSTSVLIFTPVGFFTSVEVLEDPVSFFEVVALPEKIF
jgi:hypothetical protein